MQSDLSKYDLLIVSDLHLSEGRNPAVKKFSPNEDFFFDEEFARFLGYHSCGIPGRPPDKRWHLIINGDFLDFLQVVSTDIGQEFREYLGVQSSEEARALLNYDRDRAGYGFGCGPRETIFKLWKIMDGHWQFFEALAEFITQGHIVTIGRGNHDVELLYVEVQAALAPKLRRIYKEKLTREHDLELTGKLARFDEACRSDAIRFMEWFHYEKELLWIEHGNQYDKVNSFRYGLSPLLPNIPGWNPKRKDEIDLPWGSLFVRYLFNKVEKDEPFADNIKPQTKFIWWFLTHHFGLALRFLFGDGRYMLKKMQRSWRALPVEAYSERKKDHDAHLGGLAAAFGIPLERLVAIDNRRAPSVLKEDLPSVSWKMVRFLMRNGLVLPLVVLLLLFAAALAVFVIWCLLGLCFPVPIHGLVESLARFPAGRILDELADSFLKWLLFLVVIGCAGFFLRWLFGAKRREANGLLQSAKAIAGLLNVQYVIMGHTHDTDLQSLDSPGREYFNTGTWTKVFSEEERLIREESELVFLQALRKADGLRIKLLKWNDGAGEPRLVKLFD